MGTSVCRWQWLWLIWLCIAVTAEARFQPNDRLRIEDGQDVGPEYYNDQLSYLYPVRWEKAWTDRVGGYRTSAGSFNADRFWVLEDLQLQTPSAEIIQFRFRQMKEQTLLADRQEREAALIIFPSSPLQFGVLSDGDTDKKWIDAGVLVGLRASNDRWVEGAYWSVDHYYATKEAAEDDAYLQHTRTYSVRWQWDVFFGESEWDTPLEWQRTSEGYHYDRRGWRHKLQGQAPLSSTQNLVLIGRTYRKEEARWQQEGAAGAGLVQIEQVLQCEWQRQSEGRHWQRAAIVGFSLDLEGRRVDSEQVDLGQRRREVGLLLSHYQQVEQTGYEWGLIFNRGHNKGLSFDVVELKAKTAVDWQLSSQVRFLLNITWDLDRFADGLEGRGSGNPWGGGQFQVMATL